MDSLDKCKIFGPYRHNTGYRCQMEIKGKRRWAPMEATPQAAERTAQKCLDRLYGALPVTVADGLARYRVYQEQKGNKPDSIKATSSRMYRFFEKALDRPLPELTERRALALYERLHTLDSERTGKALSVDSHRNMLAEAKTFLNWCIEKRWIRANPLAMAKGVGRRRRHGKSQLRIDEARKLRAVAHQHAAAGDDGAVAVLMAMLMGLRASEITKRVVRDLDDQGRRLWIPEAKTDAGRRPVPVPQELQGYLLARTKTKLPPAPLFMAESGGMHWRDWITAQTRRMCRLAEVPEYCAHSLRGFVATVAVQAGAVPELVASVLGHTSASVTLNSYAAPGSVQMAEQRNALDLLGPVAEAPAAPPKSSTGTG